MMVMRMVVVMLVMMLVVTIMVMIYSPPKCDLLLPPLVDVSSVVVSTITARNSHP